MLRAQSGKALYHVWAISRDLTSASRESRAHCYRPHMGKHYVRSGGRAIIWLVGRDVYLRQGQSSIPRCPLRPILAVGRVSHECDKRLRYGHPYQFGPIDLRRRIQALRDELIACIAAMFPEDVSITRPGGKWRTRLRLRSGLIVSVLIARPIHRKHTVRWRIDAAGLESEFVTLLARVNEGHCSFLDFHVFPNIDRPRRFFVSLEDPWLNRARPLTDLLAFCKVVDLVHPTSVDCAEVSSKL